MWETLDHQVARRNPVDAISHPVPTSLIDWLARGGLAVGSAAAAVVIFGWLLGLANSSAIAIVMAIALAVPAAVVIRLKWAQLSVWASWAWIAALAILSAALVLAEVVNRLQ